MELEMTEAYDMVLRKLLRKASRAAFSSNAIGAIYFPLGLEAA